MDRPIPTVSTRILISAINLYRRLISPLLPPACRFHPTCSQYAHQAIARHGSVRGSWMALKRVCRCHPFHPGGEDPVR
jgi:putative membrane protein insertion efficiency factor